MVGRFQPFEEFADGLSGAGVFPAFFKGIAGMIIIRIIRIKRQSVVANNQPCNPSGQRRECEIIIVFLIFIACAEIFIPMRMLGQVLRPIFQTAQPFGVGAAARNHGLKQAQRQPFVAVVVGRRGAGFQFVLKKSGGFAQVVQQGGKGGGNLDGSAVPPRGFVLAAQDVAAAAVGRNAALRVELPAVADYP